MSRITPADLEAYLDEALPPAEMAAMETAMRGAPELIGQLAAINARRDAGMHSLGDVWRRNRLSCPPRDQWRGYLQQTLAENLAQYLTFHLNVIGCRFCLANVDDLRRQQQESTDVAKDRRSKYFQSSAGHLRKKK